MKMFAIQLVSGKIWSEQKVLSVEVGLGRGCKLLGSEKPLEVLRSGNGEISVLVHVLVALELGENEVRESVKCFCEIN